VKEELAFLLSEARAPVQLAESQPASAAQQPPAAWPQSAELRVASAAGLPAAADAPPLPSAA